MKQLLLIVTVILAIAIFTFGQKSKTATKPNPKPAPVATPTPAPVVEKKEEKCTLTLSESPTVRGLKLGMSRDAASKAISDYYWMDFTSIKSYPKTLEYASHYADDIYKKLPSWEGVRSVSLEFYKGNLYQFKIEYLGKREGSMDDVTKDISQKFSLPNLWESPIKPTRISNATTYYVNGKAVTIERPETLTAGTDLRRLTCSDFEVDLNDFSSLSIRVIDLKIDSEIKRIVSEGDPKNKPIKY